MSKPFMRPEKLSQSWPKEKCWELPTQILSVWMRLEINPLETNVTVINVDILMRREIVWCLARIVSNVVVRTTLGKCVGPRDLANPSQSVTQESQARLMVDVLINVEYMR